MLLEDISWEGQFPRTSRTHLLTFLNRNHKSIIGTLRSERQKFIQLRLFIVHLWSNTYINDLLVFWIKPVHIITKPIFSQLLKLLECKLNTGRNRQRLKHTPIVELNEIQISILSAWIHNLLIFLMLLRNYWTHLLAIGFVCIKSLYNWITVLKSDFHWKGKVNNWRVI